MFSVSIKGVFATSLGEIVLLLNERDEWELPGGRIEAGESPQSCLRREIEEELDVPVQVGPLIDTYLFEVIPGKHVFIVTYACTLLGAFDARISDEHRSFGCFPLAALPERLPEGYRRSIALWAQTEAHQGSCTATGAAPASCTGAVS